MTADTERYANTEVTRLSFEQAVEAARSALEERGFGSLCEIDVQAKLKEKLDVDIGPYLILGACNPALARQALAAEPDLGVLLPCNVAVYERDGEARVAAVSPERMLSIVGNDELDPVAADVGERFEGVLAEIRGG